MTTQINCAVLAAMALCISSCTVDNVRDEPPSRPPNAQKKVDEAFTLLTPAQHLAIAKRDYRKSFFVARKHLEAIPKGAPEYAQVPTVRREIDDAEDKADKAQLPTAKLEEFAAVDIFGNRVPSNSKMVVDKTGGLELLDGWKFAVGQFDTIVITGRIKNNSPLRKYRYAQITFNLYDQSGAQVGSALANVNGLEPGVIWKFEAPVLQRPVARASVSEISGF